jgi:hypothetical protein
MDAETVTQLAGNGILMALVGAAVLRIERFVIGILADQVKSLEDKVARLSQKVEDCERERSALQTRLLAEDRILLAIQTAPPGAEADGDNGQDPPE